MFPLSSELVDILALKPHSGAECTHKRAFLVVRLTYRVGGRMRQKEENDNGSSGYSVMNFSDKLLK